MGATAGEREPVQGVLAVQVAACGVCIACIDQAGYGISGPAATAFAAPHGPLTFRPDLPAGSPQFHESSHLHTRRL